MADPDLQASFEEYVAARRPALLRTAYLLTGDRHDAEDLVQTALLKAVPHWAKIRASPDAYLRTTLAHEATSRWRRRRWREQSRAELDETETVQTGLVDGEDLRRALLALAPRQRAVVVLRYYEDLTEAETARMLGVAVGTVKSQARDALARLRTLLPEVESVAE